MITRFISETFGSLPASHTWAVLFFATLVPSRAIDGYWSGDKDGNWGSTGSWIGGTIPGGKGATAYFDQNITGNRTITASGTLTLGHLVFRDTELASHTFSLNSTGKIVLDDELVRPTITVHPGANPPVAQINVQLSCGNGFRVLAPAGSATLAAGFGGTNIAGAIIVGSGTDHAILRLTNDTSLGKTDPLTAATDSALVSATHHTEILPGSTLDLYGDRNLATEFVKVSGPGVNNEGAIVNTLYTGESTTLNALQQVQLTGDTTFGGTARWDIRSATPATARLFQDGHALTKIGTNQVSLHNVTVVGDGDIVVNSGTFSIETGTSVGGAGTIRVTPGGRLMFWNNTGSVTRNILLDGGILHAPGDAMLYSIASNVALSPVTCEISANGIDRYHVLELTGVVSGSGGVLTKSGTGTLLLSNSENTYSGVVSLTNGGLSLGTTGRLPANNSVYISGGTFETGSSGHTIGSGKVLRAGALNAIRPNVVGTINLAAGSHLLVGPWVTNAPATTGGTLGIEGSLTANTAEFLLDIRSGTDFDRIEVTEGISLTGLSELKITPATGTIPPGSYQLFTCGGALSAGAGNLNLTGLTNTRQTFGIAVSPGAKTVTLNVTGTAVDLVWQGGGTGDVWSVAAPANWQVAGTAQAEPFFNLDRVAFTDAGAAHPVIDLTGVTQPGTITVDSTADYQFTGTGTLGGCATLTKRNTGTLTINSGDHDFFGGVKIEGGSVSVSSLNLAGNPGALGTNGTIQLNGGTLRVTGTTVSDRLLSAGTNGGTLVLANGGNLTHLGPAPTGTLNTVVNNGCTLGFGNGGTSGASAASGNIATNESGSVIWNRDLTAGSLLIATTLSGSGDVAFKCSGINHGLGYSLNSNNSTFAGRIRLENATLGTGQASSLGSAAVTVGDGSTLGLSGGTFANTIDIRGSGSVDSGAFRGALRFTSGATASGTVTLTGDAVIGVSTAQTCSLTGVLAESGGPRALDLIAAPTFSAAVLQLNNSSSRTGPTFVSGLNAKVQAASALGSGDITVRRGASKAAVTRLGLKAVTLSNNITLASDAATGKASALYATLGALSVVEGDVLVTAQVADGGHFGTDGTANSVLRLNGAIRINAGSGVIPRIQSGTIELGDTSGRGNLTAMIQAGGTVKPVAPNGIQSGIDYRMADTAAAVFDLNGFNQTVGKLTRVSTYAATVTNNSANPAALTIRCSENHAFTGVFSDGTGTLSLIKDGAGVFTMGGTNAHSGPTVAMSGTLAGTGSSASDLVIRSGAALAPGAGAGVFKSKSASFGNGSILRCNINSAASTGDQLRANGNVNLGDGCLLEISDAASTPVVLPPGAKLALVRYSGFELSGNFANLPNGHTISVGPNRFVINCHDTTSATETGRFVTLTSVTNTDLYSLWSDLAITARNGDAAGGFADDADDDTIPNGLEWMLGSDPLTRDREDAVRFPVAGGGGIDIEFEPQPDTIGQAALAVQWSDNPGSAWNSVPIGTTPAIYPNGISVSVDDSSPVRRIVVHLPASLSANGKLFARVRAVAE